MAKKKRTKQKSPSKKSPLLTALSILLILGMCASAFLLYEKFSPTASEFCTFGESFDCGIVNKSPYATLDGISYLLTIDYGLPIPLINIADKSPVLSLLLSNAFLGLLALLFILLLINAHAHKSTIFNIKNPLKIAHYLLGFGVLYGIFLIYIQHSILKTWCIFCLSLDVILITSFILLTIYRKKQGGQSSSSG